MLSATSASDVQISGGHCEICGTEYDWKAYQIVLPETVQAFDRVECARRARAAPGKDRRGEDAGRIPPVLLDHLEEAGAQLFHARIELEAERRRCRLLEAELGKARARIMELEGGDGR